LVENTAQAERTAVAAMGQASPAAIHRDDPAVEEHARLDPLPPEVVDQQESVVGLELMGAE
jgi:hypothetical protein